MSKESSKLRFTGQEVLAFLEEEEEDGYEDIEEDGGMEDIYAPGSDEDLGVNSDIEGDEAFGSDSDNEDDADAVDHQYADDAVSVDSDNEDDDTQEER